MATHSSILAWKIPWTEEPGVSEWWDLKWFSFLLSYLYVSNLVKISYIPFVVLINNDDNKEQGDESLKAPGLPGSWAQSPQSLQSMGLQRVGYNWVSAHVHTQTHTHTLRHLGRGKNLKEGMETKFQGSGNQGSCMEDRKSCCLTGETKLGWQATLPHEVSLGIQWVLA